MKNVNTIRKTLPQISEVLNHFISEDDDFGLLSGYSGTALFYAYYYRLTSNKKYLDSLNAILQKTISALGEKDITYSHCSGISGIAWGIQHLVNTGLVDHDEIDNAFEEIDELLFDTMKIELSTYRYDFLHEGLGILLYFLERLPDPKVKTYLEQAVIHLENSIVTNSDGITWRDYCTSKSRDDTLVPVYNMGLSHGVPAILSVLSMIYEKGIATDKTLPLIENGVKWLVSNKNEPGDNCLSLYPTSVTDEKKAAGEKQSRIGWCYGDLSVAVALLNIGTRLPNHDYKQEAYQIFEYTLKNRNIENGNILDASLCHGSMGVSHIYRRAYLAMGDSLLINGADQWLAHTLSMANWKDGLAGFKYHTHRGYENNYSLLEGITGIGLGLIAALDNDNIPAWDRCLLLS